MAEILFAVMTSRATRERAASASSSWCASDGAHCRFFADAPSGLAADGLRHWTTIKSAAPKKPCCKRGKAGAGFFCSAHRSRTLAAQYRYLPALRVARRSELVASGRVQWVVLLDDDSVVFVPRLRALLSQYDAREPWMLGEFKHGNAYACGGAGAVFSRAALARLDLDACIARTSSRCMQSDWQLADCVAHARTVRREPRHGCGTCAVRPNCTVSGACLQRVRDGCHFMQDAQPLAPWLERTANCSLAAVPSPSIVHGVRSPSRRPLLGAVAEQQQQQQQHEGRRASRAPTLARGRARWACSASSARAKDARFQFS